MPSSELSESPTPSVASTVDPRLMLAVSEFQAAWQTAWRVSEDYRSNLVNSTISKYRWNFFHCDHRQFLDPASELANGRGSYRGFPEPQYYMIQSRHSVFGVCPTWLLAPTVEEAQDESSWRDGALRASQRPAVAQARAVLIAQLEHPFMLDSANSWLAGQLVRFQLDARDFAGAKQVAQRCAASAWWCASLSGLVRARQGDVLAADSAFALMRRSMSDSLRCSWEDLGQLLPKDAKDAYRALGCNERDDFNARVWWLADPLWRQAGNDRLVEQEARRMDIALRQATQQDERYSWDDERGGDAVASVIERYGWPTYTAWAGPQEDRSHSGYLVGFKSPPTAPYTTFEYTLGRIRAIPAWRAITSPFEAASSDWQLTVEDATGKPTGKWWPEEHFKPSRRLVQLPDGQTVSIRRQSTVEVATSLKLAHPALLTAGASFDVMLVATTGPTQIDSIAQREGSGGATVVLRGIVSHTPTLLAVEALGLSATDIDARTRFAYAPPLALSTMRPDEIALSEIAMLAPLSEQALRAPSDTLLSALLPTRTLASGARRIVLYWENYGTQPGDSATLAVRVASDAQIGLLRRVGMAAGIASDPNSFMEIRWKDHETRGGTTTLLGPVPVQMRTLSLDLGALKPGPYTIEVAIMLKDGRTAVRQVAMELLP